jgi:hypothetical protein
MRPLGTILSALDHGVAKYRTAFKWLSSSAMGMNVELKGTAMAKQRKSQTTRKPPVPADSHDVIQDWLRHQMPDLNPIMEHLDEVIRETIPDLHYAVPPHGL